MIKTILLQEPRIEGTSLIFATYPITGVIGLISFLDDLEGVDSTHYFEKSFRYTVDEIAYTDWMVLNSANITALNFDDHQVVRFELQYDKKEPPGENELDVNSVEIEYDYQQALVTEELFSKTVFKQFFESDDVRVLNWYLSVVSKLYGKGLIADFISRTNVRDETTDFLQLWGTVARFFAYYVVYARQFADFHTSDILLFEFLQQRGMNLSSNMGLEELNAIMRDFYQHIAKRGTISIADKKEEGATFDGELVRLLDYNQIMDELLFNPRLPQYVGWNVGNHSPLHRGLMLQESLDKTLKNELTSNTWLSDGEHYALSTDTVAWMNPFKVNSKTDYLFEFNIKTQGDISVYASAYDKDMNVVGTYSLSDRSQESNWLDKAQLYRDDKYLPIRLFLYHAGKKSLTQDLAEIHQGQDLVMHPDTVWVRLYVDCAENSYFYGMKFLPLKAPYSSGFIQSNNIIDLFAINNNHKMSFKDVYFYIIRYLIPYNSKLLLTNMDDLANIEETDQIVTNPTIWIGGGEFCETLEWRGIDPSCEVIDAQWIGEESTAFCQKQQ